MKACLLYKPVSNEGLGHSSAIYGTVWPPESVYEEFHSVGFLLFSTLLFCILFFHPTTFYMLLTLNYLKNLQPTSLPMASEEGRMTENIKHPIRNVEMFWRSLSSGESLWKTSWEWVIDRIDPVSCMNNLKKLSSFTLFNHFWRQWPVNDLSILSGIDIE